MFELDIANYLDSTLYKDWTIFDMISSTQFQLSVNRIDIFLKDLNTVQQAYHEKCNIHASAKKKLKKIIKDYGKDEIERLISNQDDNTEISIEYGSDIDIQNDNQDQENQETDNEEVEIVDRHRERDFITKVLVNIFDRLLEEFDDSIFELNWIEIESCSVTNRKRKAIHEEYTVLTSDAKKMDLIVKLRRFESEVLLLKVGNTMGPIDDTKNRRDHSKLKIVMKDCLDALKNNLHFKKIDLEEIFIIGIQVTSRKWTIYSLSYNSLQNFYFFVEMATLIFPKTLQDMEIELPIFLEKILALRIKPKKYRKWLIKDLVRQALLL
ncbi:7106_t:CDS:2 [Acaulospora morrowiae]|uniref:7106_t:CDS:1 n=1 Tax=Acaulospora morrowiae TaxID=94023 RepID=A0A9N9ACC2_9GLOM|nr:7106_t:CDS:2 [Acaulospora morrowiae]